MTRLEEIFCAGDVVVGLQAGDKWQAIDRLLDRLVQGGRVPEERSAEVRDALIARERSMSTGMERGIAIPHAAVDGLDDAIAALGIVTSSEGLEFESIDREPTHFVVLLLIPREKKLLHIRTLADIARRLGKEAVRRQLLESPSADAARAVFCEAEP